MLQLKLNNLVILIALVFLLSLSNNVQACQQAGEELPPLNFFVSLKNSLWSSGQKNVPKEIGIINCKNTNDDGYLQIAKGVLTYSSENYSALSYLSNSIPRVEQCTLESDQNISFDGLKRSEFVKQSYNDINNCMGFEVVHKNNPAALKPIKSTTCDFEWSPDKSKVIFKGDNCILKNPQGDYRIVPVVLPGCYEYKKNNRSLSEVEGQIIINFVSGQKENRGADTVSDTVFRLNFLAEDFTGVPTSKNKRFTINETSINSPSDYMIDLDYASLSLNGVAEYGIQTDAQYLIKNISNENCNNDGYCSSSASYRAPLVLRHELFLIKRNQLNERTSLGLWYSGSIVPAMWAGINGNTTYNKIYADVNYGKLNTNSLQIQDADILLLSTTVLNPNSGSQAYIKHLMNGLKKKNEKIKIQKRGLGGHQIQPLPEIESLTFKSILKDLEFDTAFDSATKRTLTDLLGSWPSKYGRYCLEENGQKICKQIGVIEELAKVDTFFEAKNKDGAVSVRPLKTYKENILEQSKKNVLSKNLKMNCR